METAFHATTIVAVSKDGKTAIAGDGQVTMGNSVIMKGTAQKVRRLYNGKVVSGFAGSVADAFSLFDRFEAKLNEYNGNLIRSAVELAKDWRSDKVCSYRTESGFSCYPEQVKLLNPMTVSVPSVPAVCMPWRLLVL